MKKSKIITIIIIALLLEVFLFNITSFRTLFGDYEVIRYDVSEMDVSVFKDRVSIKIDDINKEIATFKIEFKNLEEPTKYRLYFSDETTDSYYDLAEKTYIEDFELNMLNDMELLDDNQDDEE